MIRDNVTTLGSQNGVVRLEAPIDIAVAGAARIFHAETVAIDKGFTGWLVLPQPTIDHLGLTFYGRRPTIQASGATIMFDIYSALVRWHERDVPVLVHKTDGKPLLGMALLNGSRLTVDARDGGDVVVEQL